MIIILLWIDNLSIALIFSVIASFPLLVVRRPDRRDLLAYLSGETATSQSIDKSAHIEVPIPVSEVVCSKSNVNQQTENNRVFSCV